KAVSGSPGEIPLCARAVKARPFPLCRERGRVWSRLPVGRNAHAPPYRPRPGAARRPHGVREPAPARPTRRVPPRPHPDHLPADVKDTTACARSTIEALPATIGMCCLIALGIALAAAYGIGQSNVNGARR